MKFEISTVKFVGAGKRDKISNFIGWFCLKDILLEQKSERTVSCPDTEGLSKVSVKSDSWFLI